MYFSTVLTTLSSLRNGLLRVLHLNGNNLTSLDANSLRGMRFMRRLYFADNQINRVGRGTFRAVTRCEWYHVNNTFKLHYEFLSTY